MRLVIQNRKDEELFLMDTPRAGNNYRVQWSDLQSAFVFKSHPVAVKTSKEVGGRVKCCELTLKN